MDRGSIKFKFGGVERNIAIKIGMAPVIEDTLGVGLLAFVRNLGAGAAQIKDSLAIIKIALSSVGVEYSDTELWDAVDDTGITETHTAAALIVGALLKSPKKGAAPPVGKKQPASS